MANRSNPVTLFRPGKTMHGNVVLNFVGSPNGEFRVYASAYRRAGRSLAVSLAAKGGYRDLDACPIVFLYRHALELYLKAIVRRGQDLVSLAGKKLPIKPRALEEHKLAPLWMPIQYIFTHLSWTWSTEVEGARTLEDIKKLLQEVDQFDSGSYSFRYPVDTKGKSSVSRHFCFNVLEFAKQVEGALGLLEGTADNLEEEWDQQASEAYARQETKHQS
jgi:hypothetical protein